MHMHKWNMQEQHLTYQLKYKQQQNWGNLAMYDSSKESGNKFQDMDTIHLHEVWVKFYPYSHITNSFDTLCK